jgi:hypothetical protein
MEDSNTNIKEKAGRSAMNKFFLICFLTVLLISGYAYANVLVFSDNCDVNSINGWNSIYWTNYTHGSPSSPYIESNYGRCRIGMIGSGEGADELGVKLVTGLSLNWIKGFEISYNVNVTSDATSGDVAQKQHYISNISDTGSVSIILGFDNFHTLFYSQDTNGTVAGWRTESKNLTADDYSSTYAWSPTDNFHHIDVIYNDTYADSYLDGSLIHSDPHNQFGDIQNQNQYIYFIVLENHANAIDVEYDNITITQFEPVLPVAPTPMYYSMMAFLVPLIVIFGVVLTTFKISTMENKNVQDIIGLLIMSLIGTTFAALIVGYMAGLFP